MSTSYSREILDAWKAGEIQELAYFLNDEEGQGTFVKFVECGVGYLYPSFVTGDESLFEKHERTLIEYAQDDLS